MSFLCLEWTHTILWPSRFACQIAQLNSAKNLLDIILSYCIKILFLVPTSFTLNSLNAVESMAAHVFLWHQMHPLLSTFGDLDVLDIETQTSIAMRLMTFFPVGVVNCYYFSNIVHFCHFLNYNSPDIIKLLIPATTLWHLFTPPSIQKQITTILKGIENVSAVVTFSNILTVFQLLLLFLFLLFPFG